MTPTETLEQWEAEAKKTHRFRNGNFDFDKIDILIDEVEELGRFKNHLELLDLLDLASYAIHLKPKMLILIDLVRKKDEALQEQKLFASKLSQFAKSNEKSIDKALILTENLK